MSYKISFISLTIHAIGFCFRTDFVSCFIGFFLGVVLSFDNGAYLENLHAMLSYKISFLFLTFRAFGFCVRTDFCFLVSVCFTFY